MFAAIRQGIGLGGCLGAASEGQVKAMLLVGDSPNFGNGRIGDGLAALDNLEFLVVMDSFLSAPARVGRCGASSQHLRREGWYIYQPGAAHSKGSSLSSNLNSVSQKSELWVLGQLGQKFGVEGFAHSSSAEVMEEISRVVPTYAGVTLERLDAAASLVFLSSLESPKPTQMLYASRSHSSIQWPAADDSGKGTPVLYRETFPSERQS